MKHGLMTPATLAVFALYLLGLALQPAFQKWGPVWILAFRHPIAVLMFFGFGLYWQQRISTAQEHHKSLNANVVVCSLSLSLYLLFLFVMNVLADLPAYKDLVFFVGLTALFLVIPIVLTALPWISGLNFKPRPRPRVIGALALGLLLLGFSLENAPGYVPPEAGIALVAALCGLVLLHVGLRRLAPRFFALQGAARKVGAVAALGVSAQFFGEFVLAPISERRPFSSHSGTAEELADKMIRTGDFSDVGDRATRNGSGRQLPFQKQILEALKREKRFRDSLLLSFPLNPWSLFQTYRIRRIVSRFEIESACLESRLAPTDPTWRQCAEASLGSQHPDNPEAVGQTRFVKGLFSGFYLGPEKTFFLEAPLADAQDAETEKLERTLREILKGLYTRDEQGTYPLYRSLARPHLGPDIQRHMDKVAESTGDPGHDVPSPNPGTQLEGLEIYQVARLGEELEVQLRLLTNFRSPYIVGDNFYFHFKSLRLRRTPEGSLQVLDIQHVSAMSAGPQNYRHHPAAARRVLGPSKAD